MNQLYFIHSTIICLAHNDLITDPENPMLKSRPNLSSLFSWINGLKKSYCKWGNECAVQKMLLKILISIMDQIYRLEDITIVRLHLTVLMTGCWGCGSVVEHLPINFFAGERHRWLVCVCVCVCVCVQEQMPNLSSQ
jgi:hypothetical protein